MATALDRLDDSAWWETPLQTRNEHFGSFDSSDFPTMSMRQPEWRLSPLDAFSPIVSGPLDGGHYSVTVTNAEFEWVPHEAVQTESPAPEDVIGALAWEHTVDALVVTVSGEGEPAVVTRQIDGVRAGHLVIRFAPNTHRTLIINNTGLRSHRERRHFGRGWEQRECCPHRRVGRFDGSQRGTHRVHWNICAPQSHPRLALWISSTRQSVTSSRRSRLERVFRWSILRRCRPTRGTSSFCSPHSTEHSFRRALQGHAARPRNPHRVGR